MDNLIREILEITKKHEYFIDNFEVTQSGSGLLFLHLTLNKDCEEVI